MRIFVSIFLLTSLVFATSDSSPRDELGVSHLLMRRGRDCEPGKVVECAKFSVQNTLFDTSGSQCTTTISQGANIVVWSTQWTWSGPSNVPKSFANAQARRVGNVPIANFSAIPSTWEWSFEGKTNLVAAVAYEILLSSTCGSAQDLRLQVWLGQHGGVKPSGQHVDNVTIKNLKYKVFKDSSDDGTTYTFEASNQQAKFSGDLLPFVTSDGIKSFSIPLTSCIYSTKAGVLAFAGENAVFQTASATLSWNVTGPDEPSGPAGSNTACAPRWGQCAGQGWSGPRCCQENDFCAFNNDYHSQCLARLPY